MSLENLDSKSENEYLDKKLLKTVGKSVSMFRESGIGLKREKNSLALIGKANKAKDLELNNVSDMLSKMLGGDLDEKDQIEFKLGIMELIDNLESKYIPDPTVRGILNKVLFAFLLRFKAK